MNETLHDAGSAADAEAKARWLLNAIENYRFMYGANPGPEVMEKMYDALLAVRHVD